MLQTVATTAALLVLLCGTTPSAALTAAKQRDVTCDDLEPLRTNCHVAHKENLEALFHCSTDQVLARQIGCYYCVDRRTCLRRSRSSAHVGVRVARTSSPPLFVSHDVPVASPLKLQDGAAAADDDKTDVVELSLPFIPDALSMAESAQFNGVDVATSSIASRQDVSHWFIMAPALLALASLGLAARSRARKQQLEHFERLADSDRDDEINPFCASLQNPQDDDCDVAFAARYTVASDDDDDDGDDDAESHRGDSEDVQRDDAQCQPFSRDNASADAVAPDAPPSPSTSDYDIAIVVSSSSPSVMAT